MSPQTIFVIATAVVTSISADVASGNFVIPKEHRPIVVMGKDYWPALYRYEDWAYRVLKCREWCTDARKMRFDNSEILKIPAFRDAVPVYYGHAEPPPDEAYLQTWPTMAQLFHPEDPDKELLWTNPQPEKPCMFWATCKRDFRSWAGELKLDFDDFRKWKALHPNLMYDGGLDEWDNDFDVGYVRMKKMKEGRKKQDLIKLLGERPKNRYEREEKMRKYFENRKACCYGGDMYVLTAHLLTQHLGGDCGASYLALETTDTTGPNDITYRWNMAQMFVRGAARQFHTPWEWYLACYRSGYAKDGSLLSTTVCVYPEDDKAVSTKRHGPEYGISANLLRRAYYYAWVNGPTFTQLEEWTAQLLMWDSKECKTVLSPRAKDYIEFHNFTQASGRDRGIPYTPVALCLPIAQFYATWGGFPAFDTVNGYHAGDYAVDAAFYTLVPGYDRTSAIKRGVEYPLMNSPYAMMYDVIVPDGIRQSEAEKLKVFKSYKAIVVLGEYRDKSFEKLLSKYEESGGRVIRVDEKMVEPPAGLDDVKTANLIIDEIRGGKRKFKAMQKMFEGLELEYFPFKVKGDCLYGANRTKKGWLVYLFNNKGVTKFCDAPHTIDHSFDAKITVSGNGTKLCKAKNLVGDKEVAINGGEIDLCVPAGDFVMLEIE